MTTVLVVLDLVVSLHTEPIWNRSEMRRENEVVRGQLRPVGPQVKTRESTLN